MTKAYQRSKRQSFVVLICLGLLSYFVYHAINGRHGLEARAKLSKRATVLSQKLADLETVRRRLERNIALLESDNLDPDMLEEQARRLLAYARPGDIIVVETSPPVPGRDARPR